MPYKIPSWKKQPEARVFRSNNLPWGVRRPASM